MSDTNPKAPEGAIAIPEDVQEFVKAHSSNVVHRMCMAYSAYFDWKPQDIANMHAALHVAHDDYAALAQRAELAESRVKELEIELESANRALTEENARLKAPVTNEEGKDAGLFDDGMTDGQLRSWMSKVNTQMLELILTTRPLDKPAWYVRLMTEEVQRRRLESRREQ